MNKLRQRKLEARQRRQESLRNSSIQIQEPKIVDETGGSVNLLNETVVKNNVKVNQGGKRTVSKYQMRLRNKKKNLAGVNKITAMGKEKKND